MSNSQPGIRKRLVAALGNKCKMCGIYNNNPSFFDVDHIVANLLGKKRRVYALYKIDEYQILCPNCHRLKTLEEGTFYLHSRKSIKSHAKQLEEKVLPLTKHS